MSALVAKDPDPLFELALEVNHLSMDQLADPEPYKQIDTKFSAALRTLIGKANGVRGSAIYSTLKQKSPTGAL